MCIASDATSHRYQQAADHPAGPYCDAPRSAGRVRHQGPARRETAVDTIIVSEPPLRPTLVNPADS
jgi:hypothetical protein